MGQNKKLIGIAPFTGKCAPLISHISLINPAWKLSVALAPSGIAIDGEDIGILLNTGHCGVEGTDKVDALAVCDAIIISPDNEENNALYDMAIEVISYGLDHGKEIWCLQRLQEKEWQEFQSRARRQDCQFHYLHQEILPELSLDDRDKKLFTAKVPIVGIGELAEDVDGFEVLLGIVKECKQQNLRISVICENLLGELFGFHVVEMLPAEIVPEDYLRQINKMIQCIDESEKPDLIFVLFPNPIIPYNTKITFDFSISAFIIAQAIKPSYFICCSPFGNLWPEFWKNMSRNFEAKFGFGIDAVHISNRFYDDSEETWDTHRLPRICIPLLDVEKAIRQNVSLSDSILFNLKSPDDRSILLHHMLEELFRAPYYVLD